MRDLTIYIIILLIITIGAMSVAAQEIRLGAGYSYELTKKYELELGTELRTDLTTLNNHSLLGQAKISYKPLNQIKVALSTRYLAGFELSNDEIHEDSNDKLRFAADLEYSTKRFDNDIKLSNRFRGQYSFEQSKKSKLYLRNKITIDYKISKHMSPFIAVEPYYNYQKRTMKKIRLYTGTEIEIYHKEFEMYLIHEVIKQTKSLTHFYIMGVSIKI